MKTLLSLRALRLASPLVLSLAFAAFSRAAPVTVDILVVYTPAARAYAGGADGMLAAINSYIATTNAIYANSDIGITLRLAGSAEVSYVESTSFSTDLGRLQNPSDGYMDEVAGLRDTYGTDLVALIRRNSAAGVAGLAYVGPGTGNASFASYAFSVTADVWAVGNYAFPHELGHNYGSWHDRQNTSGTPHAYAYGWRFYGNNGTQYATVMAYQPGVRIPHFSNPSILYQGQPTGVASPAANAADNALLHEVAAPGTAAFRASGGYSPGTVRGDFNGDGHSDLVLFNPSTGARQLWYVRNGVRVGSAMLPGASTAWNIATVGDFNADGFPDIVFQNLATGERSIGLYRGNARIGTAALASGTVAWRVLTSGDFNADGKPDLLFQNVSTGERSIGLFDGATRTGTALLASGAPQWLAVATGDFNGDGKTDIVFQNTSTGERSIGLYDGTTRIGTAAMAAGTTLWPIVGGGDFNGDGQTDLVYQNTSTGEIVFGFFNGTTRTSTANLSGAGAWRISNR